MELVYDYVSEERKEEVKKMGILTPYGGLFEPREKFGNLKYVKSKDEYYLFKRIIPGVEYSEYENDGIRYLFICGKKYYYVELPIEELRPNPYQPRKVFDKELLEGLASSIKEYGILEPIIVKKSIKGYEIVAGERRSIAAKMAGLSEVPAIIRDFNDEEMMSIALLENIQRENLNIIEEALAYKKMIEVMHITQEELSTKVGKSRSHITNILGILKLPSKVQDLVLNNKITMGHARCLSKLEDESEIFSLAQDVVNKNLSVRELEDIINDNNSVKKVPIKRHVQVDERHNVVQSIMREKIGTMVKINNNKIVIPYDSDKDLERILEILNIEIED